MKENLNVLDELNKACNMGMDAINYTLDKTEDDKLKKALEIEYNKYKDISKKINEIYANYTTEEPHKTNTLDKIMTFYGVQMKTLTNHSNQTIAEMLLKGTNMGIIEGRKILNNKKMDKEIKNLLTEFISMQEDSVETLKSFL